MKKLNPNFQKILKKEIKSINKPVTNSIYQKWFQSEWIRSKKKFIKNPNKILFLSIFILNPFLMVFKKRKSYVMILFAF